MYMSNWSLLFGGVLLLGMFYVPDVALAGRVADIASAISKGSGEKVQQLTLIGIYSGVIILLLILLNLVQQKKGAKRLVALVTLLLLGTSFVVLHFA
jgi:hypothetical protein